MVESTEFNIQQLADRVGEICRAHPEAILDRQQWGKDDKELKPKAKLGLLGLAGSRWCSAADRAAILADSPPELCNPKTISKIKNAFLKKTFCDMLDIDDDQYRNGSVAMNGAQSTDSTPSKQSKSLTPPTTPERNYNFRPMSITSNSSSGMAQSKKLSPVALAFVPRGASTTTPISTKFDPNKYGNPCFKAKLAAKPTSNISPSQKILSITEVVQKALPVNHSINTSVESRILSIPAIATSTTSQNTPTVIEVAEAVIQIAEVTPFCSAKSIKGIEIPTTTASILSTSHKTDIKQHTQFVPTLIHSTCNPKNGLAENISFIPPVEATRPEEHTQFHTLEQIEDPVSATKISSTIPDHIALPEPDFLPPAGAVANHELSMDFQKKMAGFDRNKYGNPCFKKAPAIKSPVTVPTIKISESQVAAKIEVNQSTSALESAIPNINGVTYINSTPTAEPSQASAVSAVVSQVSNIPSIVFAAPDTNADTNRSVHNASVEANAELVNGIEPTANTSVIIAQAQATNSHIKVEDQVVFPAVTKSDGRWPHPALALDDVVMMRGVEYISKTILSEVREAHINGNTDDSTSGFRHNVNVKYINDVGVEELNPKEGIRAMGGTERDLIDFDGSMAPAPCDWEDARPPLDPEFKPTYIDEWCKNLPCGNALCVDTKCPGFLNGQHPINNTVLDPLIPQPDSKPDIEGAENKAKRAKQTANYDSELLCAKNAKRDLNDKLTREAHVAAQAKIAKAAEEQEEINTYRPTIVSYIRPVEDKDATAIQTIYNHYVKHSIVTEDQEEISSSDFKAIIGFTRDQKLPFVVAIAGRCPIAPEVPGRSGDSNITLPETEQIVGFSFAERVNYAFSGKVNGRSRFTAGLQLFVHPQYTRKGFARNLMDRMMYILNPMHSFHNATPWISPRTDPVYEPSGAGKFHQIVFQIPVEKQDDPNFSWVLKFLYTGFWFKEEARLKSFARTSVKQNIGHPRFVDLSILRAEILHPSEFENY